MASASKPERVQYTNVFSYVPPDPASGMSVLRMQVLCAVGQGCVSPQIRFVLGDSSISIDPNTGGVFDSNVEPSLAAAFGAIMSELRFGENAPSARAQ